jgi:hypothetical protein
MPSLMNNSFLAFGFVSWPMAGVAAGLISVPIIIHILNRRRFKTVTWAAMEFLMRAMRKNRRRLEFEQWILLATRCLVVFLLGLALARPLGCEKSSLARIAGRTGLNVIVLDNSYSMAYQADRPGAKTHLDQAKKIVDRLIEQMSPGGESVVLITAAGPVNAAGPNKSIFKIGYDLVQARDAAKAVKQSYGGTDLVGALRLALQAGRNETREQNKRLYILTDATRGAWDPQAAALKQLGPELAKMFKVVHYDLTRDHKQQWNDAVLDISAVGGLVRVKFDSDFRADVRTYGPPQQAYVQWKVDDKPLGTPDLKQLSATAGEIVTKQRPQFPTGGPHLIAVEAKAGGDHLPADNIRNHVEDVAADLKILLVEGQRGAGVAQSSGSSLAAALTPAHEGAIKTLSSFVAEPISDLELGNRALHDYSAVVLADVSQVTGPEADRLKQFVEQGGTLLVFMGESINKDNYNTVLLPRKLMPGPLIKLMSIGTDQPAYRFNFKPNAIQSPYLESFRGMENSGLDLVIVRKYWQLDLPQGSGVDPILKYIPAGVTPGKQDPGAPGDPAITDHTLGQGRVIWCSITANDDWTDFPAHIAYAPLMQELLAHSVKSGTYWMNLDVGQPLVIPSNVRMTAAPTLLDPDKKAVALESKLDERSERVGGAMIYTSPPLATPGVYALALGESTIPIAVNVPAAEADLRTLTDEAIREDLGRIDIDMEGDQPPGDIQVAEAGRDWGWHLTLLVLGLLCIEAFMAMRFGHWKQVAPTHA